MWLIRFGKVIQYFLSKPNIFWTNKGGRILVDIKGKFSWPLFTNSHGHFCPLEFLFLGEFLWTFEVMSARTIRSNKSERFRDKNNSVYFIGLASKTDVIQLKCM